MSRFVCLVLCIVPFSLFGCCITSNSPKEREQMKDVLQKTYQGTILHSDGQRTEFTLRLEHNPTQDLRIEGPFFFLGECPFPALGVKGAFTKDSKFLPGVALEGLYEYYDSKRTMLRLYTLPKSEDRMKNHYVDIGFDLYVFTTGVYRTGFYAGVAPKEGEFTRFLVKK